MSEPSACADVETDSIRGLSSYLANIYGSEQDKVNCAFWTKIGACRHGDRCSRKHIKPLFSQTLVIANMYQNPTHSNVPGAVQRPGEPVGSALNEQQLKEYFDQFCQSFHPLPQSVLSLTLLHLLARSYDHEYPREKTRTFIVN